MVCFSFILLDLPWLHRQPIHHYGLASVSFTGLSCYLIYTGLYSSAVIVSQDTALRQSIRRSVTEQSKLLDSIGTAHMEQELQSRVLTVAKKLSDNDGRKRLELNPQ